MYYKELKLSLCDSPFLGKGIVRRVYAKFSILLLCFVPYGVSHSNTSNIYDITDNFTQKIKIGRILSAPQLEETKVPSKRVVIQKELEQVTIQGEMIKRRKKAEIEASKIHQQLSNRVKSSNLKQHSSQLMLAQKFRINFLTETLSASYFNESAQDIFVKLLDTKNSGWMFKNSSEKNLGDTDLTVIFSKKNREKIIKSIASEMGLNVTIYSDLKLISINDKGA